MERNSKIYVAGHNGLVGTAIIRQLRQQGYNNLLIKSHSELDLTQQKETLAFFESEKPEYAIIAAGLVGGIKANSESPCDFFSINMAIALNTLTAAYKGNVKKLLYLGSSCMYPKECRQPMNEEDLLTGLPEVTNEAYALAKICGSRMCSYFNKQYGTKFISAIPANAYGINDHFEPEKSHVIPGLIAKYHEAKCKGIEEMKLWGSGTALREFIFADDIADACIFLMNTYSGDTPINVGTGEEISIWELSCLIKKIVGYKGSIVRDLSKPDGMMRRIVNNDKVLELGWQPKVSLEEGIKLVYSQYLKHLQTVKQ